MRLELQPGWTYELWSDRQRGVMQTDLLSLMFASRMHEPHEPHRTGLLEALHTWFGEAYLDEREIVVSALDDMLLEMNDMLVRLVSCSVDGIVLAKDRLSTPRSWLIRRNPT